MSHSAACRFFKYFFIEKFFEIFVSKGIIGVADVFAIQFQNDTSRNLLNPFVDI